MVWRAPQKGGLGQEAREFDEYRVSVFRIKIKKFGDEWGGGYTIM